MAADPPLAARLMLDALTEFRRVMDALPARGRGGAIGRLNPGSTTVLHVTRDTAYLGMFATGTAVDPWVLEQLAREDAPPFPDAEAAFDGARGGLAPFLEAATNEDLARIAIPEPMEGLPAHLVGVPLEYLVARTAAHVFVHAGEMSALASLVGAPDLGLPGAMAATRGTEA